MNKFLKRISVLILILFTPFLFAACNNKAPNPADKEGSLSVSFNGFDMVDETTFKTKVSNDTEILDIGSVAEIEAEWKLTTDIQANEVIASKIATPLQVGNNTFYALVSNDENVCLYTLHIRRRPMYEVVFKTNGGTEIASQGIEEDSVVARPNEPFKKGYEFLSWDKETNTPIAENTVFTANWQPITYQVRFNKNDDLATGSMTNQTFTYDVEQPLDLNVFEKQGYAFNGWTEYANGQSVKNLTSTKNKIIDLYARWEAKDYNINYFSNEGKSNKSISQSVKFDSNIKIKGNTTFKKTGYSLIKWNTQPDGNGIDYPLNLDILNYSIPNNLELYAVWEAELCKINFETNGGVLQETTMDVKFDSFITLPVPTNDIYYRFEGWFIGNFKIKNGVWNKTEVTTLTAKWLGQLDISKGKVNGTTEYGKTFKEITIPAEINSAAITSIEMNAFATHDLLEVLNISENISFIHNSSLMGNENLNTINVTGNNLFFASDNGILYNKDKTVLIKFPANHTLTSYTTDFNIININDNAFYNVINLNEITISENIKTIGNSAFYNCKNLTEINFNATSMNDLELYNQVFSYAGIDNMGITINVGENVLKIPANLFHPMPLAATQKHQPKVSEINFHNNSICESIGESAFTGSKVERLNLPASLITIGDHAFSGLGNITLLITKNITYIGSGAFGHHLTVFSEYSNWEEAGWEVWYGSLDNIYYKDQWHYDEETGEPTLN